MSLQPVTILLATFNGDRFLPAQLASIAAQVEVDWQLLWRDDGSTDSTVAVLEAFAARHPGRVQRLDTGPRQLGIGGSFQQLLAAASGLQPVAFCDQDDVWLPDKLARALAALGSSPDRPALYCARQRLVDAQLQPLTLSPGLRRRPGFGNALVQNIATGCTLVLNPAARQVALSLPMPTESLHDWWSYLTVTAVGGTVIHDPEPAVLYRQHGRNAVGAKGNPLSRAAAAWQRGTALFLRRVAAHAAALRGLPGLRPDAARQLNALLGWADPRPQVRLTAMRRAGLYRQTPVGDLALAALCVTHRLPA